MIRRLFCEVLLKKCFRNVHSICINKVYSFMSNISILEAFFSLIKEVIIHRQKGKGESGVHVTRGPMWN